MSVIGYQRVSSYGQNEERQLTDVDVDEMFTDKACGVHETAHLHRYRRRIRLHSIEPCHCPGRVKASTDEAQGTTGYR